MAGESLGKNGRAVRCAQKEESMADNKKFQVALDLFTIEDAMRISGYTIEDLERQS